MPLSGKLPRIVTNSTLPPIMLRETMQSIAHQLLPARMQLAQAPVSPQFDIKSLLPSRAEQRSIERYSGRPLDSTVGAAAERPASPQAPACIPSACNTFVVFYMSFDAALAVCNTAGNRVLQVFAACNFS